MKAKHKSDTHMPVIISTAVRVDLRREVCYFAATPLTCGLLKPGEKTQLVFRGATTKHRVFAYERSVACVSERFVRNAVAFVTHPSPADPRISSPYSLVFYLEQTQHDVPLPFPSLSQNKRWIDEAFSGARSVEEIIRRLEARAAKGSSEVSAGNSSREADDSATREWARGALDSLAKASPTSLKVRFSGRSAQCCAKGGYL